LAIVCAEHGVELVDAPVSGGAPGAQRGRLAVMVGGSETAFERVRGPFGCFADLVVHAGPVGAGTRMKLARNLLHFVAFTAASEAQRLAEAADLDITTLGKVVRHSDAVTGGPGAIMLRDRTAPIEVGDFWLPILGHVRDLGEKDLTLALDLGTRLGVELPLAELALDRLGPGLGVVSEPASAERESR
jgi:3-hydroxyisobutyrate dehydrogenase